MAEELKALIKSKREKLSDGSLRTYASILTNLFKKLQNDKSFDIEYFNKNHKDVLTYLKNVEPQKRKTTLSALVVITDEDSQAWKQYRELMMADSEAVKKQDKKQEMTEKQKDNWVDMDDISKKREGLKKEVSPLFKKQNPTSDDLQKIQNYIILCLYTMIPPRRLLDYTSFKIKNIDKQKDNFMEKDKFVFNQFKTAKFEGQQQVTIPKALKTLITKWIKINPTDYLLFDTQNKPLNSPKLNQRLYKIFDKKISSNMLRHIKVSDELKNVPALEKLEELAHDMGHSIIQQQLYRKIDKK